MNACLVLGLLSASGWNSVPRPEVENYFLLFTADAMPYNPTRAHTFAAVVSVERKADGTVRIDSVASLSWLPEAVVVRAFALRSETGRNVPLNETLDRATQKHERICGWGPYRVTPEFAAIFRERVRTVESEFRYKGACLTSPKKVCDCARSIEEMIDPRRRYIGAFGYGAAAGSYIVRQFTPSFVDPQQSHAWVACAIGLDAYPINWRPYGDFTNRCDQLRAWLKRN